MNELALFFVTTLAMPFCGYQLAMLQTAYAFATRETLDDAIRFMLCSVYAMIAVVIATRLTFGQTASLLMAVGISYVVTLLSVDMEASYEEWRNSESDY